jgi:hypothetical protein
MKNILFVITTFIVSFTSAQTGNSCDEATPIQAGTHFVETISGESFELNCTEYNAANGNLQWYSYTPLDDFLATVTSDFEANEGGDTRFHVYKGECSELNCVTGDDDSGDGYLSTASFSATAGETYYIAWDDHWSNSSFEFQLIENDPPPPPPADAVSFTIEQVNYSGSARAMVDMNNDYKDDLVSISSTNININYQLPEGGLNNVNITTTSADNTPGWSLAAGDIDGNGYNDLLYGGGNGVTFMKANSDGTAYEEISGEEYVFSQRSNFVDINNDGHLDAFVCHDVQPTVYYINDGQNNLQFFQGPDQDGVNSGIGGVEYDLAAYPGPQEGGNYGSVWIDFDNDRDVDLFIAKCRGGDIQWKYNELWRNNGDGTFSNIADLSNYYNSFYPDGGHDNSSNLGDPMQTWSSAWGDYDNDGYLDVYVGASSNADGGSKLMKNNGDGTFMDVSSGSGIEDASNGIENAPGDFNNDGFIDVLSNGRILLNNGDMTFTVYNTGVPGPGGIGDINSDGFLDVFNGQLYVNDGNENNWITVSTQGVTASLGGSNANGIGARVEISSSIIGTQIRDVQSGTGFRYMSSLNTHFGLGNDTEIASITVYWPSGIVDELENVSTNQHITITEGETLSINEPFSSDLIIYPNPVLNTLNIEGLDDITNAVYSIFDLQGKRVHNEILIKNSIDVSELAVGQYILRVTNNKEIKAQKFIKK